MLLLRNSSISSSISSVMLEDCGSGSTGLGLFVLGLTSTVGFCLGSANKLKERMVIHEMGEYVL